MIRKIQNIMLHMLLLLTITSLANAQDAGQKWAQNGLLSYEDPGVFTTSKLQLSEALGRLENKFDVSFIYKVGLLNGMYAPADIGQSDDFAGELRKVLQPLNLKYSQLNNRTFAISVDFSQFAQKAKEIVQHQIEGTVTDASTGETMPGVNILVKGTATGTSTNAEGVFKLEVESPQDTLVFSFIGYQIQEVPVAGRTTVDVALHPQAISGEELVVIGYGTVQKKDLTGSVSSVSEEDFNTGAQANVDQLIQGRVPGVHMTQTSGEPGARASIRIRGANSNHCW